jgi:sulfoxide reductase heme-binding subunit YedZ
MDATVSKPAARRRPWHAPTGWRPFVYTIGMLPAVYTFYLGVTDQLGADPMRTLEQTLGVWALRFLMLGLAVTPMLRLGGPNFIAWRRAFGLIAFAYAVLHLTTYLVLDQGLDLRAIWGDIVKRTFITIGMAAFVILVPLAITSNDWLTRRMGAQAWQRLHRLVYVAVPLGAVHFIMSVKSWPPEPTIYLVIIAALLGWRVFDSHRRAQMRAARVARR